MCWYEFQKLLLEQRHNRTIPGTLLFVIFTKSIILSIITLKILLIRITTLFSRDWGTHFLLWKSSLILYVLEMSPWFQGQELCFANGAWCLSAWGVSTWEMSVTSLMWKCTLSHAGVSSKEIIVFNLRVGTSCWYFKRLHLSVILVWMTEYSS